MNSIEDFLDPNYTGEGVNGMWMTIVALVGLVVNGVYAAQRRPGGCTAHVR